ncbi:MAG TPA: palindromic element RPE4 domain-containing protein [Rickettsia endosymbiont of Degeeriella rufa]|nr:palindromic element RPE4 domain-containing protein [Rickettsia endosymbiont of Columbicola hoogstraali]HJD62102.1 palindromic element RPE4 domain-containing protein [Rickettsia endosymbiont of Degeeriella rufa]
MSSRGLSTGSSNCHCEERSDEAISGSLTRSLR